MSVSEIIESFVTGFSPYISALTRISFGTPWPRQTSPICGVSTRTKARWQETSKDACILHDRALNTIRNVQNLKSRGWNHKTPEDKCLQSKQGFTRDPATPICRKSSHFFPLVLTTRSNSAISKGHACPVLQTRCLSHLWLWEREVPNTGSSLDHGNIPVLESSHSKRQQIPRLTEAFMLAKVSSLKSHACTYEKVSWDRYNLVFVSWRGSITSCCWNPFLSQLKHSAGSAGVAGIQQQFRHIPPSPSAHVFVRHGAVSTHSMQCCGRGGTLKGTLPRQPYHHLAWPGPCRSLQDWWEWQNHSFESLFSKLTLSVSPWK